MTQRFEGAQPQVVKGKHKYRGTKDGMLYPPIPEEEEGRQALNIMYDKRVFRGNTHNLNILKQHLTPSQKEEQRIKEEREKKKIEMIKMQLLEFKKSKNTTSPYELRPGPPARIEVDLTYFLTEQGKIKPEESEVKIQTDAFQPKPPSPRYVPKKTGIDKITQIEDYDLFDYDVEVQPILNVLLNKSIEQATLEVEEEHELDQIRKFKIGYHKRRQAEDAEWQQEVKREMQRIKAKNKSLDTARMKRKQQFETIQKLQCMNIAKNFLANNFKKSMQYLADKNHWRNTFKDQLNVDFKDWLYDSVSQNLTNKTRSKNFKDGICNTQISTISKEKDPIKKSVRFNLEQKEKSRQIESKDKRVVHFLFNSGLPTKISPIARKMKLHLQMSPAELKEFEEEEKEKFLGYIEKLKAEELDEGEQNPVVFGTMPYFHCELSGGLSRIAFSTADDPFYKSLESKYYPEAIVIDENGEIAARINPNNRKSENYHLQFQDDFRDPSLKINDDRKIQIHLNQIHQQKTIILLTVKTFMKQKEPSEKTFERAWFRLSNEETNQTIDYSLINKIEIPDDYQETIGNDDDEDSPPFQNELVYIFGVIYQEYIDGDAKWVFESFKKVLQAKDYRSMGKDVGAAIGQMMFAAQSEYDEQEFQINQASDVLKRSIEEKKLQALEAAKKAKGKPASNPKGQKPGQKDEIEELEAKNQTYSETLKKTEETFDLNIPAQFEKALKARIRRPFIFGPVEFEGLNLSEQESPFDSQHQRDRVKNVLDKSVHERSMHEKSVFNIKDLCIHGYKVRVKRRTLKRRSSLLKHARFLQNLEALPEYPKEPEPIAEAEGEGEEDED